MSEPIVDPTPEELAKLRTPEMLTPSEKEIFEGKILELKEKISQLEAELAELKKPKPIEKKSFLKRWEPL